MTEPSLEYLKEVFWKAYEERSDQSRFNYRSLKQSDLYDAGFSAVRDALIKWSDNEWAKRYLALQEFYKPLTYKFTNVEP